MKRHRLVVVIGAVLLVTVGTVAAVDYSMQDTRLVEARIEGNRIWKAEVDARCGSPPVEPSNLTPSSVAEHNRKVDNYTACVEVFPSQSVEDGRARLVRDSWRERLVFYGVAAGAVIVLTAALAFALRP